MIRRIRDHKFRRDHLGMKLPDVPQSVRPVVRSQPGETSLGKHCKAPAASPSRRSEDSDDELQNLYRSASSIRAKVSCSLRSLNRSVDSCIRLGAQRQDLDVSASSRCDERTCAMSFFG